MVYTERVVNYSQLSDIAKRRADEVGFIPNEDGRTASRQVYNQKEKEQLAAAQEAIKKRGQELLQKADENRLQAEQKEREEAVERYKQINNPDRVGVALRKDAVGYSTLSNQQLIDYGIKKQEQPTQPTPVVQPMQGNMINAASPEMVQSSIWAKTKQKISAFKSGVLWGARTDEPATTTEIREQQTAYEAGLLFSFIPLSRGANIGKAVSGTAKAAIQVVPKTFQAFKATKAGGLIKTGVGIITVGEIKTQLAKKGAEEYTSVSASPEELRQVQQNPQQFRESFNEAIYASEATLPHKTIAGINIPTSPRAIVYSVDRFLGEKVAGADLRSEFKSQFEESLKRRGIKPTPELLSYAMRERGTKQVAELGSSIGTEAITERFARQGIKRGATWLGKETSENILKKTTTETTEQFLKRTGKEAFKRQMPTIAVAAAGEGFLQYRQEQVFYDQKFSIANAGLSTIFGATTGIVAQRFITVPSIDPKTRWQSKVARGAVEVLEMGQEKAGDLTADLYGFARRRATGKVELEPTIMIKTTPKTKVMTATFGLAPAQAAQVTPQKFSTQMNNALGLPTKGISPSGFTPSPVNPPPPSPPPVVTPTINPKPPSNELGDTYNQVITSNVGAQTGVYNFAVSPSASVFAPNMPPPVPIMLPAFAKKGSTKQTKRYIDELSAGLAIFQRSIDVGGKPKNLDTFKIGKKTKRRR